MKDKERLIAFLYRLIRDDITSGKIENHMREIETHPTYEKCNFSNIDLEKYCRKLVKRLID